MNTWLVLYRVFRIVIMWYCGEGGGGVEARTYRVGA